MLKLHFSLCECRGGQWGGGDNKGRRVHCRGYSPFKGLYLDGVAEDRYFHPTHGRYMCQRLRTRGYCMPRPGEDNCLLDVCSAILETVFFCPGSYFGPRAYGKVTKRCLTRIHVAWHEPMTSLFWLEEQRYNIKVSVSIILKIENYLLIRNKCRRHTVQIQCLAVEATHCFSCFNVTCVFWYGYYRVISTFQWEYNQNWVL